MCYLQTVKYQGLFFYKVIIFNDCDVMSSMTSSYMIWNKQVMFLNWKIEKCNMQKILRFLKLNVASTDFINK